MVRWFASHAVFNAFRTVSAGSGVWEEFSEMCRYSSLLISGDLADGHQCSSLIYYPKKLFCCVLPVCWGASVFLRRQVPFFVRRVCATVRAVRHIMSDSALAQLMKEYLDNFPHYNFERIQPLSPTS